jgi:uncharacterized damage-inducible protein DinB
MTDPARVFRQLAHNARLANRRLSKACMALQPGEWEAERTSFFPSLKLTMVHLLDADRWYFDLLRGSEPALPSPVTARATAVEFAGERDAADAWMVEFAEQLKPGDLARNVVIPWPNKTLHESLADALLHVFTHGQHHRGQIHAMLSGTSIKPPQIDEFILLADSESRAHDLAELGWDETRMGS